MLEEMKQLIRQITSVDPSSLIGVRARVMLRDELVEKHGFTMAAAGDIALAAKIELPEMSDEDLRELIEPMARYARNVIDALVESGFDEEAIVRNLAKDFSITMKE